MKRLDPDVVIAYHLTASNGGLIFPRDFVLGVKFGRYQFFSRSISLYTTPWTESAALIDGCFVAGGCSVDFPPLPPEEDLVRAWNHPSCMVVR